MTTNIRRRSSEDEPMSTSASRKGSPLTIKLRNGVWSCGNLYWIFSIISKSFAFLADGYLSVIDLTQLLTVSLLFIAWIYLKPETNLEVESLSTESISALNPHFSQTELEKLQPLPCQSQAESGF